MLRVVLNRLKAKFEEMEAEERVDFRPDRSTVELSSKVELSQRSTYNISAIWCTTPQTSTRRLTESGMQAFVTSLEASG